MRRLPPPSTLFPYTTLFRSIHAGFVKFELDAPRHQTIERHVDRNPEVQHQIGTDREAVQLSDPLAVDAAGRVTGERRVRVAIDRKSTRLNSSHEWISYAVFC